MIGAGDGGLPVERVAPAIVLAVDEFFVANPATDLREIFLLVFTARDKAACEKAILEQGRYELIEASGAKG